MRYLTQTTTAATPNTATSVVGISLISVEVGQTISQNTIYQLTTPNSVLALYLGDAHATTVTRNKIYAIPSTSGSTGSLYGIYFGGAASSTAAVTIANNQISIVPAFANAQAIYGIFDYSYSGNAITSYYNSVYIGGTATGTSSSWAYIRGDVAPTTSIARNNIFFNNRTGGTGSHFAMGDQSAATGTFAVGYNLYAGTGATAANYMDRGTAVAGTPVAFSAWATAASDATSWADRASVISAANLERLMRGERGR